MASEGKWSKGMSELINCLVKIGFFLVMVGQLPKATVFMAKEFAKVQHRGLGSLEKFSHALQRGAVK